jgi:hypothetical protein
MIAKLQCVVLDCADVVGLSRFYQSLLGGVVNQPDPRWSLGRAGRHSTPVVGSTGTLRRVPAVRMA